MEEVPQLKTLCKRFIEDGVINLDNAFIALDMSRTFELQTLKDRAEMFIKLSYAGIAHRYTRDEIDKALGHNLSNILRMEHEATQKDLRRFRMKGSVLDTPAPSTSLGASPPLQSVVPMAMCSANQRRYSQVYGSREVELCCSCGLRVFKAEQVKLGPAKSWHVGCFRCSVCLGKLRMDNANVGDDKTLFCNAHFKASAIKTKPNSTHAFQGTRRTTAGGGDAPAMMGAEKCRVCGERAYLAERISVRTHRGSELLYHTGCFRCSDCGGRLRADNWEIWGNPEALEKDLGVLCCRVHYAQRQLGPR